MDGRFAQVFKELSKILSVRLRGKFPEPIPGLPLWWETGTPPHISPQHPSHDCHGILVSSLAPSFVFHNHSCYVLLHLAGTRLSEPVILARWAAKGPL